MDATNHVENKSNITLETTPLLTSKLQIKSGGSDLPQHSLDVFSNSEHICKEAMDTIGLAVPIFLARVSFVGMKATDTALLGHVSSEALSASALSDLWTMCTGVLVRGGILRILCTQAIGAGNPKLCGIYLQISYLVLSIISIFVIASWFLTEKIWLAFGEYEKICNDAGYYAKVLSLSIPAQIAFGQLSQFFSSQRIMYPEVTTATVALGMNLILGLVLVLGVSVPSFNGYGFSACPIVTSAVVYIQFIFFWLKYCYNEELHKECWTGWSWKEITKSRVKTFSELYFPATLSLASDFWRMAAIGTIAAKLGEDEVGLFNMSYRIIWIVLTLIIAVGSAASIKIGTKLGKRDPNGARQSAYIGIFISLMILLALSIFLSFHIRLFGKIFTDDIIFLDLLDECKWPFIATLFFMNLSVAIEYVPISMGRTKEVFWMGFVASWFGQVPGVYFLTMYWQFNLYGLYTGVAIGYVMLVILYSIITLRSDWKKYSEIAIERSEG